MNEFEKEKQDRLTCVLMTRSEFALLGDGEVAYIKQLDSDAAERLFPTLSDPPKGIDLYAVLGADGTPLALTDSRNAAIANAIENDLVPVSVH
ncbi:MAG TPA: DUF1150 domain-containing protein [Methyloceanibacter sp.]|nr:DUF1150 domain-containing protein [Methyloceanibacter sp.]